MARLGPLGCPVRRGTFAWQAWHLATLTCVLRGRRGAWQHAWTFVVRGKRDAYDTWLGMVVRLGPLGRPGRRGTFAWQAWRLAT